MSDNLGHPGTTPASSAPDLQAFARRLASALEGLEMGQRELSRRSGIQPAAISRFVGGEKTPHLANLIRLLRAMPGVNANWLLGLCSDKTTDEYAGGYLDAMADAQEALQEATERAERRLLEDSK